MILSGYKHSLEIPINYSVDGAKTNFQLRITAHAGVFTNVAGEIGFQGGLLNSPYDVRFTDADGVEINFFRQSWDGSVGIWMVKVPSIAASGTTSIWVHWGKADATDASDIAATAKDGAGFVFPRDGPLDTDFWSTVVGSPFLSLGPVYPAATSGQSVDVAANKYSAWSTIVIDRNGREYIFYRTADSETHGYEADGKIAYRYSDDDFATASDEVTVTSNSNMDERDPGAMIWSPGGVESIILTYNEYDASANSTMYCQIAPISTMVFGEKITIKSGANRWSASNPVLLSDGSIGLVTYTPGGNVYLEKSENNGANWAEIVVVEGDTTYQPDESCLVELKTEGAYQGKIAIFSRCEVSPYAYRKVESTDYGDSWGSYAAIAVLSAPDVACPPHVARMPNGHLSFIYTDGYNIVQYVSGDEAATWVYTGILVDRASAENKHYAKAQYIGEYAYIAWSTNTTTSDIYFNKVKLEPFLRFASTGTKPVYILGPNVSKPCIIECRIQSLDDESTYKYVTPFGLGRYIADYSTDTVSFQIYSSGGKYGLFTTTAGARSLSGSGVTKDHAWSVWKIIWVTNLAQYFDDDVQKDSNITTNVPSSAMPLMIGRTLYNNAASRCNIDWIFVREYTANEPTWAAPGTQENRVIRCQVI